MQRAQRPFELAGIRRQRRCTASERCQRSACREPRADERLVHAVARHGVDQPGGVAHHDHPLARGDGIRRPDGKPEAAQPLELIGPHAVGRAQGEQMAPQVTAFLWRAAHTDVHVVGLRKQPPVAADDPGDLDHRRPPKVGVGDELVGQAPFDRHAVRALDADRARADAVRSVGSDHDGGADDPASEAHARVARADRRRSRPVDELGSGGDRLLDEELVEPDPARHEDQRRAAAALEAARVVQAHQQPVHLLLDDRRGRERQRPHSARRQPPATRLVAGKARAIDEQHGGAGYGEMVGRERSRRSGANDDDVVAAHRLGPTIAARRIADRAAAEHLAQPCRRPCPPPVDAIPRSGPSPPSPTP